LIVEYPNPETVKSIKIVLTMAKNAKIRSVTFGELPIIRATFGDMKLFEFHRPLVDMLYVAETVIDPPVTKMIGCISAGVLEEYDEATNNCKHHGYISKVAVRIFHRRRGLATRLITFVEDEMKQVSSF
jgi:ribosomal protein S18 acetylase RimI-like enzyme